MARKLIDEISEPDFVSWNALISGYCFNGLDNEALGVVKEIQGMDIKPNASTLASLIPNERFFEGFEMFREMLQADVQPNSVSFVSTIPSSLMSMYAKLGDMSLAKFLFNQMPNKMLLSWNVMISGYLNDGLWDESMVAFREMQLEGFSPDAVSIVSIISACFNLDDILLGESAHAFVVRRSFETNITVSNTLRILL
ncbi:hypothetical protein REPUB_Repub09cG0164800 [Reevesia pubescens]